MEKNAAAKLRRAKENEGCIDNWYHCPWTPQPETLGWGLGAETQTSELNSKEKGCVKIASGAREQCTMGWNQSTPAEGVQEEAWAHRRSRKPQLERARGGRAGYHKISFSEHTRALRWQDTSSMSSWAACASCTGCWGRLLQTSQTPDVGPAHHY